MSETPVGLSMEQLERLKALGGWHAHHEHATAATITKAADTGGIHLLYGVLFESDKAGAVGTITAAGVVVKRVRVLANTSFLIQFAVPLNCQGNGAVVAAIDGTAACAVSMWGITVDYQ